MGKMLEIIVGDGLNVYINHVFQRLCCVLTCFYGTLILSARVTCLSVDVLRRIDMFSVCFSLVF